MASSKLPTMSDETQEAGIAQGKHLKLYFLKTTDCPTVGFHVLLSLDRAMDQAGIRPFWNHQNNGAAFLAKIVSRLQWSGTYAVLRKGRYCSFMGFSEYKTLPFSYWTEIVPFCFDCWPSLYGRWLSFFKRHKVRLAFFTARQSAEYFADALPSMNRVAARGY